MKKKIKRLSDLYGTEFKPGEIVTTADPGMHRVTDCEIGMRWSDGAPITMDRNEADLKQKEGHIWEFYMTVSYERVADANGEPIDNGDRPPFRGSCDRDLCEPARIAIQRRIGELREELERLRELKEKLKSGGSR